MIVPTKDRIVVKQVEAEETTKGGLILTDKSKEYPLRGEVVAIGVDVKSDLQEGSIVLFSKHGPETIKEDGEEFKIMPEDDVIAVIRDV